MTLTFYAKQDIIQVLFHAKLPVPRSKRTVPRLIKAFGLVHWGVGSERFFGLKDTKSSRSKKASWHWPNSPRVKGFQGRPVYGDVGQVQKK